MNAGRGLSARAREALGGMILLAFVIPAFPVGGRSVAALLLQVDASPLTTLSLVPALIWAACALGVGGLRRFLIDLGEWLLGRVPLAVWVLGTVVAGLMATSGSRSLFWIGLAAWLAVMTAACALWKAATDRRDLRQTLALLTLNALFFVALDRAVYHFAIPNRSHNSIFIEYDPYLGWKLRAGFSVRRVSDSYTSQETINSLGFRTQEVPFEKPAGVRRIVVLGDSHTEAYTVSDHETYSFRLQEYLAARFPVQVISLGVAGFSTDQELLAYLRYGRRYQPDLVLLQFSPNDVPFNVIDRYWRGPKPIFRRYGETLLLDNVPVPNLRRLQFTSHPLLASSGIFLVLESYLSRKGIIRDVERHDSDEAWRMTDLLIRDLAHVVRADGAELVAFNAVPDEQKEDARFRQIVANHSFPYLDILSVFAGDVRGHRVPEDHHWNAKGHDKVARFLAQELAPLLEHHGATPAEL